MLHLKGVKEFVPIEYSLVDLVIQNYIKQELKKINCKLDLIPKS